MSNRLGPIIDAVVSKIESLSLQLNGAVALVLARTAAIRRLDQDPPFMVTVAKSATPERTTRRRFGLWQTAYVIDVVVHSPYAGADDDLTEFLVARDTIVSAFLAPPLVPTAVFEVDAQAADWLRPEGSQSEYNWQSLQITATMAHS